MKIGGNDAVLLFFGEKEGKSSKVIVKFPESPQRRGVADGEDDRSVEDAMVVVVELVIVIKVVPVKC